MPTPITTAGFTNCSPADTSELEALLSAEDYQQQCEDE